MVSSENQSLWCRKRPLPLTLTLTTLQGRREAQHLFLLIEGTAGRGCRQKQLEADKAVSPRAVPHGDCLMSPSLSCRNPLSPQQLLKKAGPESPQQGQG